MKKLFPLFVALLLAAALVLCSCEKTEQKPGDTTEVKDTTQVDSDNKETDPVGEEETTAKPEETTGKKPGKDTDKAESGDKDETTADKETQSVKDEDTTVSSDDPEISDTDEDTQADTGSVGGGGLNIDGSFSGGGKDTENSDGEENEFDETDKDATTDKDTDKVDSPEAPDKDTGVEDPDKDTGSEGSGKDTNADATDKETEKVEDTEKDGEKNPSKPETQHSSGTENPKPEDTTKPADTEVDKPVSDPVETTPDTEAETEFVPSGDIPVPQASSTKDAFPKFILTKSGKKLIHTYSDRAAGEDEDNSETYTYMPFLSTTTFPSPDGVYNNPAAMIKDIRPGLVWKHVIVGYDGYMFYEDTKEDFDGSSILNGSVYKRAKDMLESSQAWAESHGMKFYIVIAPNKNTIYPDYMPEGYKMASYRRYDQFVELINDAGITAVDLRDAMYQSVQANPQKNLYYKYDTHWNNHAGYIAYETTMKMIQKDYPNAVLHKKSEYQINYAETYMKDQAYYLGQYSYYKDYGPVYTLKSDKTASLVDYQPRQGWGQFAFSYECKTGKDKGFSDRLYWLQYKNSHNADAPNAYILRDSYSIAMIPFFKDSFNLSTYNWTFSLNSCKKEILETKTDVIIAIIAERNLKNYVNQKEVTD